MGCACAKGREHSANNNMELAARDSKKLKHAWTCPNCMLVFSPESSFANVVCDVTKCQ